MCCTLLQWPEVLQRCEGASLLPEAVIGSNFEQRRVHDHGTDSDVQERHQMEMQQQARSSTQLQQRRDVSALLGEKMLQGWTLLGDTCPRCSTILVRNRDRELFCVSCDMFLRPEQQAPTISAEPQANSPEGHDQAAQPQQGVHESETHLSSGKEEADAVQVEGSSVSRAHGCDKLLALLMESMEMLAEQLREDISNKRSEGLQEKLSDIGRLAATYNSICTIFNGIYMDSQRAADYR